jgi:hypothetical protein
VVPVFVNTPANAESTVSDTEVTDPVPADGLTHVSEDPVDARYWPDVPMVERPVPPDVVPSGAAVRVSGQFNVAAVLVMFGKTKLTAPILIWYLLIIIFKAYINTL